METGAQAVSLQYIGFAFEPSIQATVRAVLKSLVYREPVGRSSLLNRWIASTFHRPISPTFANSSADRSLLRSVAAILLRMRPTVRCGENSRPSEV